MSEVRRVRMKFGNAEFEADVPADIVGPMYNRFLHALEMRGGAEGPPGLIRPVATTAGRATSEERSGALATLLGDGPLKQLFNLRGDGLVVLKTLPTGAEQSAETLLLILYGYHRLKNENWVLATQLHRAAVQSGMAIRWPACELATHDRFIHRIGRRKGSIYSLSGEGFAMAQEISSRMLAVT
jgi:hypothetical protein